jgi:hypothetical protein
MTRMPLERELEEQIEKATTLEELAATLEELLSAPYGVLPDGRLYCIKVIVERVGGVSIIIRPNDHPPPHFHVRFQGFEACFEIETGNMMEGHINPIQEQKIRWWIRRSKGKLLDAWKSTRPKS